MQYLDECVLMCPEGYSAAVSGRRVCTGDQWSSTSTECVNTDFCATEMNNCDRDHGTCTSTGPQQFACTCDLGYAGNGVYCGLDSDLDGYPDMALNCTSIECSADNCPTIPNSGQEDMDGNGVGDICEEFGIDTCSVVLNPSLLVTVNLTALGINSTIDRDNDSIIDDCDNCPDKPNSLQFDDDLDGTGNVCDGDIDGDGVPNDLDNVTGIDNCPEVHNPLQEDSDGDGAGDLCDNCPDFSNPSQLDDNRNSVGDDCESANDTDDDGVDDNTDNCRLLSNPDQVCYCSCIEVVLSTK